MDLKFKLSLFLIPLKATIQRRVLFIRVKIHKRLGDIKRTPLKEVSNFIVAFQRRTEIFFVLNLKPYRLLFRPIIGQFVIGQFNKPITFKVVV